MIVFVEKVAIILDYLDDDVIPQEGEGFFLVHAYIIAQ